MTYWPRLRLTPEEAKSSSKYFDPRVGRRGVLRRIYPGFLLLNTTVRLPIFPFNIARRARVFGMTFAGDVNRFKLALETVSGEQHTAEPVFVPSLIGGFNQATIGISPTSAAPVAQALGYWQPYIIEPNIVLLPNQTLTIRGRQTEPRVATDYRLDFCLHVWEFPAMAGSPL